MGLRTGVQGGTCDTGWGQSGADFAERKFKHRFVADCRGFLLTTPGSVAICPNPTAEERNTQEARWRDLSKVIPVSRHSSGVGVAWVQAAHVWRVLQVRRHRCPLSDNAIIMLVFRQMNPRKAQTVFHWLVCGTQQGSGTVRSSCFRTNIGKKKDECHILQAASLLFFSRKCGETVQRERTQRDNSRQVPHMVVQPRCSTKHMVFRLRFTF